MAATIQALVPRMRDDLRRGQRHHRPAGPAHLRVRRAHLAPGRARAGGAAGRPPKVAAVVAACARAGVPFVARGSGTGLSGGALPHESGVLIVMSRMRRDRRDRPGEPARGRGARRDEPGGEQGRGAVRPVLRARPVQPGGLLGGRQRGGELRRGALPQARVHRAPRHRPGDRHPGRRADLARRRHRRGARLRPGRRVHRLGGHARHRHQDRGQADAGSPRWSPAAGRVRDHRRRAGGGVRHHRGRHPARRDRDDGRAGHRGRRGGGALPLPGRAPARC